MKQLVITFSHAMHPTTAPADFTENDQDGSVQETGDGVCLLVSIENDSDLESCETFSLSLATTINPRIMVTRSEVTVTLFDDEGVEILCTVVF